ncbi:MAG: S8 family serine peptidase [Longimicrobiaceae bacterium]
MTGAALRSAAARPAWVRRSLRSATGRGVRVGVVDSGWDRSIVDARVVPGIGLVDPADELALARSDDDADRNGHGTACAGLVLRVAPEAEVVPIRVFGRELQTSPSLLCEAIRWATDQRLDVVNLSLGTYLEEALVPLYAACERARRAGTVVVAASHLTAGWSYPAVFENVIGVEAERFDSPFSYRYRPGHAAECLAWGIDVPVLWLGGRSTTRTGTSFAAPQIAGIVALFRECRPGASLEEVREMLSQNAIAG